MSIITFLIQDGLLDQQLAKQVVQDAQLQNLSVAHYLVKNNLVKSKDIFETCVKHFGLPNLDLKNYDINLENHLLLNHEIIKRHRILPIQIKNNMLELGMTDPTDKYALDIAIFHTGHITYPVIISEDQLTDFIEKYLNEETSISPFILPYELMFDDDPNIVQEHAVNYDEPLIRFVDNIVKHAIQRSASDIHIEPYEHNCRVRFRQDGILYSITEIPTKLALRVVTRLKVMAKLDITERRLPQDGRFQLHHVDMRINTCPTLFGEKVALRLLDSSKSTLNINELGLTPAQETLFQEKISASQGLILVTGPTGSGKTITLYSALQQINHSEKNILTIEDPVEIQLDGINQVNINQKIGLEFSNTLRAFLRQDPDIIMVGEIRDKETADIAIQAAQTGHLVLSTLHTNSALETLTRLHSMGLATYNIVSSISLIIAQRLVRKLCPNCKQHDLYANENIYQASQCDQCLQGYKGRVGIYEVLPMTETLAQLILNGSNSATLTTCAKKEGFKTLHEVGLEKVATGITSLAELNRVI